MRVVALIGGELGGGDCVVGGDGKGGWGVKIFNCGLYIYYYYYFINSPSVRPWSE